MADIASLALEVRSDQVKQATVALKELPKAASAAERAAEKWSTTTKEAARSSEDFSRRVKRTIADLEFQRQQLARNATEQARFAALKRAGVSAASAEGQAITASVRALQAQQAATRRSTEATREFGSAWRGVIATMAAAVGTGAILKAVDAFTTLTNAIKVTGAEGSSLAFVQERLFAAANKNGVEINALGQLYSRVALAGKELGISQEQLLEFTDGVTAALRVQGGSAAQASGALLQLSQALGSGIVRAEEFNSILEGALPIAQAAARGMEGMGGSVAKLRTAILAGTVTSRQFFEATMRGFGETREQAQSASLTIGQALTSLSNSFTAYIGNADKASGASAALARVLTSVGKALDDAGKQSASGSGGLFDLSKVIASTVKEVEGIIGAFERVEEWISGFTTRAAAYLTKLVDDFNVEGVRASASFVEAFRAMPEQIGRLFVDAFNAAKAAVASGINSITAFIESNAPWLGIKGTSLEFKPTSGGGASVGDFAARVSAAGEAAASAFRERIEAQRLLNRQAGFEQDEARARLGGMPVSGPLGLGGGAAAAATSKAGQAAENAEKKYAKLVTQLTQTAEAQDKMTEASLRGEVAFESAKVHLDAQQKALEIYGEALDDTDPKLRKIEELLLRISQGKAAEAFNVATTELEKQNVILQAQIDLMDEAPEIQAREIALIKAKQEAEKAGTAVTADAIEQRQAAIEQNETLKLQQEEIRKAQELWTEPLKRALGDIQSTAADAFEGMFESGKISIQSLGDVFKKTISRMAAEFLALATIRPVMSIVVNAISPSIARQMGLGGSSSGGGGGGLLDSIFGSGSGGSGGFFGRTLYGGTPIAGAAGWTDPLATTGGVTVGGALGAAAGAGMGIYNLATSRSTGQTIGGIASLIGAGVSLIPGIGQIAGPIISILGGLAGGLFGGTPKPVNSYGFGQLSYGGGRFTTSGGAWGANGSQPGFGEIGAGIQGIFDLLGGVQDASRVFGIALESFNQQYADGSAFNNQTSFIVDPSGNRRQFGMGSTDKDIGLAAASAEVAIESILGGAVGEITENMRKALDDLNQVAGGTTLEAISQTVTEVKAFDEAVAELGKTMTPMEQAFQSVDDSLAGLYATAEKFGLDATDIDAEQWRQKGKVAQEFIDGIALGLQEINDPTGAALARLDKERADLIEQNDFLVSIYGQGLSQITQIEAFYQAKRKEIIEDANASAVAAAEATAAAAKRSVDQIQELIQSLTPGGALANVDPRAQLAGLEATYRATFAQASAGDLAARDRFTADASAYAQFAKSFFGGSADYSRIRDQLIADAQSLQLMIGGQAPTAANGNIGSAAVAQQTQQLMAVIERQSRQIDTLMAELSRTNALLSRYVANGRTAA